MFCSVAELVELSGEGLSGEIQLDTVNKVVATNQVPAAMGKICVTPMGRVVKEKTVGVLPKNG